MGSAGDRSTVSRFVDSQGSPFGQQWEVLVTVMRSHDFASVQGSPFGQQWEVQVTVVRCHDFAGEMLQFSTWTWEATVVMTDSFSLAAIKQQDEGNSYRR